MVEYRGGEKKETLFSSAPYSKEQLEKITCNQTHERK